MEEEQTIKKTTQQPNSNDISTSESLQESIFDRQIKENPKWNYFNKAFIPQTLNWMVNKASDKFFSGFSIHLKDDEDQLKMEEIFQKGSQKYKECFSIKENRAMASFLGNALGDAIGAHTEFIYFDENRNEVQESWDSLIEWTVKNNHKRTEFGVITDDCSMARCMADSFLSNDMHFNPTDMRMRFLLWWNTGYCNGSQNLRSFGLGGNIAQGMYNFIPQGCQPYVIKNASAIKERGDISGNGGIMRLSPIPIRYHDDIKKGEEIAALQSLTTHNGDEAAEVCRLLTHLVIQLINYPGDNCKKDIFDKLGETFQTHCPSVQCMAQSVQEPESNLKLYNKNFNKDIQDRYWDWKNQKLQVSPTRVKQQPGYFGSYAMDGAYLALHIAYHSENQKSAIFKAVNWGGDSDSFAAVVGYITGAMYGLTDDMLNLYYEQMQQHDLHSLFVKTYKLFHKKPVTTKAFFDTQDGKTAPLIK